MVYKRFSKKLFEQNDPKARRIAKEWYAKQGVTLKDAPNKYGPDLLAEADPEFDLQAFYVEVEVKRVWRGPDFPWLTVQFPERKAKYIYQSDYPVKFFMLNNECTHAFIVDGNDILKSKIKMVPNMYMGRDEYFFQVPLDKGKFVEV